MSKLMSKLEHWWRSHAWRFFRIPRQLRIAILAIVIAGTTTGIAAGAPAEEIAIGIAAGIAVEVVTTLSEKKRVDQSKKGRGERLYVQAWRSRRTLRRPGVASLPLPTEREGTEEKSAGLCARRGEIPAASAGMTERSAGMAERAIDASSPRLSGFGKLKHTALRFRGHLHAPGVSFGLTLLVVMCYSWGRTSEARSVANSEIRRKGKMQVSSHWIENSMLHNPDPRKTSKLKHWYRCCKRRVSCIPWRRVIDALAKALLRLAVRIMEDAVAEIAVTFVVELFRSQIF